MEMTGGQLIKEEGNMNYGIHKYMFIDIKNKNLYNKKEYRLSPKEIYAINQNFIHTEHIRGMDYF